MEFPTHPPIKAWRLFEAETPFTRDNGASYLTSPVQGRTVLFPNQVYKASCNHYDFHEAPVMNCTCGWYAFKKRADARRYMKRAIMGEVLLGGRIIETELGYRAEEMVIVKLYMPKHGVSRREAYL